MPEYWAWRSMRQRCNKPSHHAYRDYGGRGISICPRWDDFAKFMEDMGPRPSVRHSLDRIDNDGPYSPENCRWATRQEQSENKRSNRWVDIDGVRRTVTEWCRHSGISEGTAHRRIAWGWSMRDVFMTPLGYRRNGASLNCECATCGAKFHRKRCAVRAINFCSIPCWLASRSREARANPNERHARTR